MDNMHNNNNKNKRISPSDTAIIGALITLIGGFFLSYNYVEAKKIVAYDYMASSFYQEETIDEPSKEEKEDATFVEENVEPIKEEQEEVVKEITNDYIGYLVIPKINLTKGFLDKRAVDNDVEKNIYVVEESDYPDVDKGNLIIAGHSGTGWKAFFNELYQLSINDTIYITYNNKKYIYQIVNIYQQEKTGKIAIYRNYDKTTLTLITCTNNVSGSQTVYIAELINIEG